MPLRAEDFWGRSAEAYGRYLRAVGLLTNEYARALQSVIRARVPAARSTGAPSPPLRRPEPAPHAEPPGEPASMVLEAPLGDVALGAFVIENALGREVHAGVVASSLSGPDGDIEPAVSFEPAQISLAPGEQAVVRAALSIDDRMQPGLEYRGELSVPTLPGTRIPIVARRTLDG